MNAGRTRKLSGFVSATAMLSAALVAPAAAQVTQRVSLGAAGAQANNRSTGSSISADGRCVAFVSYATNLVAGDTNGFPDVFVRDRQTGTTERISLDSAGEQGNDDSYPGSLSADGRFVAFASSASNLVAGDTNFHADVFVRDRQSATTERVSLNSAGAQGNGDSGWYGLAISPDGRYVAFESSASNLVSGDTNATGDIFVRDRQSGTTERVSLDSAGAQANHHSGPCSISADGRYVAFQSSAYNLVSGDTNATVDLFVHDRQAGTTERVSLDFANAQVNADVSFPSISADGRYVAFSSVATDLVPGDTNGSEDVFVRDRLGVPSFTSLCDPGRRGVLPCPCSNPPREPGRGCNGVLNTGGAILAASGGTYLSSDSLVFTTIYQRPASLSILGQWTGTNAAGIRFGRGVRCTSGILKRLYTKAAAGGSITAPDFAAGELQVSVRSAALGDTIRAGESRWYLVAYRDNGGTGSCPSGPTFNATQTGRVDWSP